MKALILSSNRFEDSELLVPYYRLLEEDIEVTVGSDRAGKIVGKHGYEVAVDQTLPHLHPGDYSLLVLPGGQAPAALRRDPHALDIAREFMAASRPVAAICHGPQILVSAGVLRGRRATGFGGIAGEMKAAGVLYEDREVVVDGNLVTSRMPKDLPAFLRETLKLLRQES